MKKLSIAKRRSGYYSLNSEIVVSERIFFSFSLVVKIQILLCPLEIFALFYKGDMNGR